MKSIQARMPALAAALMLVSTPGLLAEKKYDLASLNGAYHFTLVEIAVTSDPVPATIYCNGYGRIVFDGAGLAEVVDGGGLCSNGEAAVSPASFVYTVAPDGVVILTEEGGSTTHCQIADRGVLFLCDGSGEPAGPPAERALWMVTAAKL